VNEVRISKDATEVMADPCDIGSSPSRLRQEFPHWDFSHLEEHWWHGGLSPEHTLALMKERQLLEGDKDVETRIGSLKRFLQQSDARTIVIVCHGDLIWWLTRQLNDGVYMGQKAKNGEIIDITQYICGD
jgi:broad specificity phosphatase PhoE